MYNYRVLSFLLFTTTFWAVEMTFAFLGWSILYLYLFHQPAAPRLPKREKGEPADGEIKTEPGTDAGASGDDLSDTSRQFPTYAGQPPLRYSSPRVKDEKEEETPERLRIFRRLLRRMMRMKTWILWIRDLGRVWRVVRPPRGNR